MARGKYWISTVLATAVCAVCVPQFSYAQPAPDGVASAAVSAENAQIQQCIATLTTDANPTFDQRQGAAKTLIALRSPQARAAVNSVLADLNFPQSQLALARALADDPDPDTSFIKPLFTILEGSQGSPSLGNAAAEALGIYKNNRDVLRQLANDATGADQTNRNLTVRVAAIRGLGLMCDKPAADTLVNLLSSTTEPAEIRNPAAEALASLSGEALGHDVQAWQQWWNQNRGKSEPDFRNDLLTARAAKLDAIQRRYADLESNFKDFLDSEYQHAVASDRGAKAQTSPEMLQSYLVSSNPVMRAEAVELIRLDKAQGNPVPTTASDQLRKMIDDSDPRVRLAVANAIFVLNDHAALTPVLQQLEREQDPAVRAALTSILGPIGDVSAIPLLRKELLNDRPIVAENAADALSALAPKLHGDADMVLVRQIAHELQMVLDRTKVSDTDKLREKTIGAMAALHDPTSDNAFKKIVNNPNESSGARTKAMIGIGKSNNPINADFVVRFLTDDDASVRQAAVEALKFVVDGKIAAPQLMTMLRPGGDNPAIQAKAWETLTSFLPELEGNQLQAFADDFNDPKANYDPGKRVTLLRAKLDKATQAGDPEERARTLQNIGEALMDEQPKQYDDANAAFDAALSAYPPSTNKTTLNRLARRKMEAMLGAGKYDDATRYAAALIQKDPTQTRDIGDLIEKEASKLSSDGEQNGPMLEKALSLIDATNKNLNQTLPTTYQERLTEIESDVRKAQAKNKGATLAPPGSTGATARTSE